MLFLNYDSLYQFRMNDLYYIIEYTCRNSCNGNKPLKSCKIRILVYCATCKFIKCNKAFVSNRFLHIYKCVC